MKKTIVIVLLACSALLATGFVVMDRKELLANPGKFLVARLDFVVDLTDDQEKRIRGIIDPVIAGIMSERRQTAAANAGPLLDKFRSGKLEKTDILKAMETRRQFAKTHEDTVADTVLKVVAVLDAGQREKLAGIARERLDEFVK